MRSRTVTALVGLALASAANAASPFRALYDLDDLPLMKPGVRTYQVSSHDPTGGNADAGHFVRVTGKTAVLADLQGPGIVRRIWSANPSGRLRITIDGASRPAVDVPFADIFQDKAPGFLPPLAGQSSGGWYSYVPIPFRKSCLITVTDGDFFYYQVTWQKVPDRDNLVSYTGRYSESDRAGYANALQGWNSLGENPNNSHAVPLPKRSLNLPPGGSWAQPIQGPGAITELRFKFPETATFAQLRQTVLRISFDGNYCVQAPLADFFGIGFDGTEWKSLPLGAGRDGAWCFFRMPFRKTARIEVNNESREPFVATFTGTARSGAPAKEWGYFHADYHSAVNVAGSDYVFGRLRGRGHVVGVTENMRGTGGLGFLEGDEKVYVDGEGVPSIYGTGTEDFYNCGWYFDTGLVNVATHGLSHKTDNEIAAWRFEIPDAIPFTRSLDFHMEHGGGDDAPGSEYASVLYWYGAPGAKSAAPPMPKGSALLPKPYAPPIEGAVQAQTATWAVKGGTLRRQAWQDISPYRGGGRALLKGRPGAVMNLPLEVRFTDRYDVDVYVSGSNTSSMAALQVDGAEVGQPLLDGAGPLPLRKISYGPLTFTEGRHTLGIALKSGSSIGVAAIRLIPRSPLVKDFAVLGPFPLKKGEDVKTPLRPDGLAPDLSASFRTDNGPVKWTVLRAPSGVLDLAATLTPNENAAAYVAFAVNSSAARTVPILLGSDDGVEVWLNGKAIYANPITRSLQIDQDRVAANLKAGWNQIVMKVVQGGGAWGVAARIPDPEGNLQFTALAPPER
ncbi:MAG TPA: glycoside hydrolase family 172 protein [Armatimonadota bacterium]|jgi:hypothetical protein